MFEKCSKGSNYIYIQNIYYKQIFSSKVCVSGEPPAFMHTNVLWLLAKRFTFILLWQICLGIYDSSMKTMWHVLSAMPCLIQGSQRAEKTVSQAIQLWKSTQYAEIVKGTSVSSSSNMLCGLHNLHLVLWSTSTTNLHLWSVSWFCSCFFDRNVREEMI